MEDQKKEIKDIFESLIEDKEQKAFNTKDQKAAYMIGFLRGAIWALKKSSVGDDERKSIIKDFIKKQVMSKVAENKKENKSSTTIKIVEDSDKNAIRLIQTK